MPQPAVREARRRGHGSGARRPRRGSWEARNQPSVTSPEPCGSASRNGTEVPDLVRACHRPSCGQPRDKVAIATAALQVVRSGHAEARRPRATLEASATDHRSNARLGRRVKTDRSRSKVTSRVTKAGIRPRARVSLTPAGIIARLCRAGTLVAPEPCAALRSPPAPCERRSSMFSVTGQVAAGERHHDRRGRRAGFGPPRRVRGRARSSGPASRCNWARRPRPHRACGRGTCRSRSDAPEPRRSMATARVDNPDPCHGRAARWAGKPWAALDRGVRPDTAPGPAASPAALSGCRADGTYPRCRGARSRDGMGARAAVPNGVPAQWSLYPTFRRRWRRPEALHRHG